MVWLMALQDFRCEVVFAKFGYCKVDGDSRPSSLSQNAFVLLIHGRVDLDFIS